MISFLKKKKGPAVFIALICAQMIMVSMQIPLTSEESYFERGVFAVFAPIQNGIWSSVHFIKKTWRNYLQFRDVSSRNAMLQQEVFNLRQENRLLKNLLLHYKKDSKVRTILRELSETVLSARVIGFDMADIFKSVVLNRGSVHGVDPDMIVLNRFGHLIGRVVRPISLLECRVQLITDTESGVSVIKKGGESLGILSGHIGGICSLKYILSTDTDIKPGDILVTTGFDGIYPPGLKAGTVEMVSKNQDLFQNIRVKPAFRFNDLDIVGIITMDVKNAY